jgi:pSer/pThr/pTyr-binding forkhead associated (FHA) protein
MNPRIVALAGPSKGKSFALTEGDFSVGREPSNSLSLNDALISRQHALIRTTGSVVTIFDLNSRNGTLSTLCRSKNESLNRDRIQIGDSLQSGS